MPDQYSLLRHSLRGTFNALKLGVSAMEAGLTHEESLEFIGYIIQATDKMSAALDDYEALPWPPPVDAGHPARSPINPS